MSWPEQVAIIGAGYMGRGIAEVLALAGTECVLADVSAERAADGAAGLFSAAARHEEDGLIPAGSLAALRRRVRSAASVEDAVARAEYVVEAVYEDGATKTDVLGRIERSVSPATVISTNTSAISVRALSQALDDRTRFLGAHWFNPPQFVPGVELIACQETSVATINAVDTFLAQAGKWPARVTDSPGFVGNRLQYALFQEAAALVEEGIADANTVDLIVRTTFGFRLPFFGPFAIADMAGLDVYRGAYRVLTESYPDRFQPPEMLGALVDQGRLGAKTGSGFVIRSADEAASLAARRDRQYVALARLVESTQDAGAATGN